MTRQLIGIKKTNSIQHNFYELTDPLINKKKNENYNII